MAEEETMDDAEPVWDADEPETFDGECECCGRHGPVQRVEDPFVSEDIIDRDPEHPDFVWCRACYRQRADDV